MSEPLYKYPRREPRYVIHVPMVLVHGGKRINLTTRDVSYRGLFLYTDQPPVLRQLIRVEGCVQPGEEQFVSHGMGVYTIEPGNDRGELPGVGVQFYAQSAAEQKKWERFILHVKDHPNGLVPSFAQSQGSGLFPQSSNAVFEVYPRDLHELESLYSKDVSRGSMFVSTPMELSPGNKLRLEVCHPMTKRRFALDSVVRQRSADPVGLGVQLVNMTERTRDQFVAFIHGGV